jgi:alpha-beta hydrolase superfamily lysophospholipase
VPPARAVLMVHGAGGGGWEWNAWTRVFAAAGWHARTPDLEPVAAGLAATRFIDYQDQVATHVARLPRPRVLVGASLGGLLALRNAQAADALVLVNPLPPRPWHVHLPARTRPVDIESWSARASLEGTRRAIPDAGAGDAWFAFRRWRDESGAVLDEARAGIPCSVPTCPVLVVASSLDRDVPADASAALAAWCGGEVMAIAHASHVGALLGRDAATIAADVVTWLNVKIA